MTRLRPSRGSLRRCSTGGQRWAKQGDEESPWATGPEIGYVSGGSMYITMTYSGADRAVSIIVAEAREFGLNDRNVEG